MSVRSLPLLFVLAWAGSAFAQDHPLLSAGPMNTYAEMTEVGVWVQTKADASVRLRYWPQGAASPAKAATQTIQTSAVGDHIAVFTIAGLPFGTKFDYEVEINGQLVPRSYPLRFQTQPLWRWQSEPPEFRIAFGSCAYFNDTPFDRPGRPYGGDHEIFDALAKKQPDMMLWLGDNVYYREADWLTESAMRYRWRHNRAFPGLQPILGFAQHYATWDDHDYGPNDSDRSFRLKGEALKVFADYFPAVRYGTPETPGTFQRFEWGDVEFFMLDDRYHRTPNRMPVDDDRTMLGKAQLQWLKDSLVNSQAVFKVVVCGGQMLNPITLYEGFGQFEAERKDLFDFLAKANISGLLFLSGDRHIGELIKVRWPGAAYDWYDFTSSPLSAGAGRDAREENNPARVPGTWVTQKRNFGIIDVTGKKGARRLVLAAHDKDGVELWKHELAEADLRRPAAGSR